MSITDNHHGTTGRCMVFLLMIDSEALIKGCRGIVGCDHLVGWQRRFVVTLAHDLSPLNTTASHQHEHATGIMISPARLTLIVNFWSAAKLTRYEDDR